MTRSNWVVALGFVSLIVFPVFAGIPEPDAILFGKLVVDGSTKGRDDRQIEVFARVDGSPEAIGGYRMGDSVAAGDLYVLHLKLELPVPESPLSPDAARIGQTADIYIRDPQGERFIRKFFIRGRGVIQRIDLDTSTSGGHCANDDPDLDLLDFRGVHRCMTGPVNSSPLGACAADDQDVDLIDLAALHPCIKGPAITNSARCECFDTDVDDDGDLADFARIQRLFTGNTGCACGDLDGDVDVDLADFALMQQAYTGSTP